MKLYYKNDKKIIVQHKKAIRWWQEKLKLSDYQTLWVTFLKGIIIGAILL